MFTNEINWLSLNLDVKSVGDFITVERVFRCDGNLEFVTFSSDGQELIVSADKMPRLVFDSQASSEPEEAMDISNNELPDKGEIDSKNAEIPEPTITSINPEQLEEVDKDEEEQNFIYWIGKNSLRVNRMVSTKLKAASVNIFYFRLTFHLVKSYSLNKTAQIQLSTFVFVKMLTELFIIWMMLKRAAWNIN